MIGNVRYGYFSKPTEKKKEYLYSVETDDGKYTKVYREDLECKNGFHHWWYQLLKTENTPINICDKFGHQIKLNDVLIAPKHDLEGNHSAWSVCVATKPKKYDRFENEEFVFKRLAIGWEHRVRIGSPVNEFRLGLTDYTDEIIYIGHLSEFVDELGYLKDYEKMIESPDGKLVY